LLATQNKISVIIICKDEAHRIRRCLDSIKWVDEIVIVDSGSTDNTLGIAAEYTDKNFVNQEWPGLGPEKNLQKARRLTTGFYHLILMRL